MSACSLLTRRGAYVASAAWRRPPPGLWRRVPRSALPRGARGLAALEAAPAVSAVGLPEAVALGITDAPPGGSPPPKPAPAPEGEAADSLDLDNITLQQAIAALKVRGSQGSAKLEDLQPLADRSLNLAEDASLEELADLAEAFAMACLRISLRDMMPRATARISAEPDPKSLPSVVRLLTATGRGSLFFSDLFEFCNNHLLLLTPSDLSTYVYEGGRHGLRVRHLLDAALDRAAELAPQMRLVDVMRTWQGFVRFSRDRRRFYVAALPRVRKAVDDLVVPHLLMALRVARDLKSLDEFVDLHAACATLLIRQMDDLDLSASAQALALCNYSPRYRAQAQGLVRSVEQKWSRTEDLSPLRVVEIVDALETFTSWGMQPVRLVNRLDDILVDRQVELKYTGNVSLWVLATQAMAKMDRLDSKWPRVAMDFARDPMFVDKISFYQQCAFISALGRLRLFDEVVYKNVADHLLAEFSLFKNVQDLAVVLWAYTTVNYFHQRLFDSAYDAMIAWLEAETIELEHRPTQVAVIQAVWSFAVAGYHTRYESFAAFLDYAFFAELGHLRTANLRRLAQLADAVLCEAPQTAALCHYHDRIELARADERTRNTVSTDPSALPDLHRDITDTLRQLSWPHEAFFVPDNSSTFYVEISLAAKVGQKVGLCVAGPYELLTVGLPGEVHPPRETGLFSLARRLLAHRGWHIAVIESSSWAELSTLEQKRTFLEEVVQRALREPLPAIGGAGAPQATAAA